MVTGQAGRHGVPARDPVTVEREKEVARAQTRLPLV